MHRITKFDLSDQYNEYVDGRIVDIMQELVGEYNEQIANGTPVEELKDLYLQILYSNPAGFELTARMSTNYRCLKNIYTQRKDHRLPEWREFCKWIETLPYAHELILCDAWIIPPSWHYHLFVVLLYYKTSKGQCALWTNIYKYSSKLSQTMK